MSMFLFCYLFCFLDSTYKWNHILFVFPCLTYFTSHRTLCFNVVVVDVQALSHFWLFSTPWTVACQASLSSTMSWSLLKFMYTESVMLSNHLFLCHSLLLLPSIFPSARIFSNELARHISHVCSAYKLNKQGDNIQPWCTSFPILNQPIVPCPALTVSSWPVYRFFRRQIRWYDIAISLSIFHSPLSLFFVIHTVKGFSVANEAEEDVFWNSFAFSMTQQIWKS